LPENSNLWLQFVSNYAFNFRTQRFTFNPQAFLYIGDDCDTDPDNCSTSNPATVTFTRITDEETVPEPASIALLLAALAAGWIQWRRARA
jgi:hypothetical protein